MWKNTAQPERPQITIWCMHIACWIPKAKKTRSEYVWVILIAFPLQQSLHEVASMLCCTYIACLCIHTIENHCNRKNESLEGLLSDFLFNIPTRCAVFLNIFVLVNLYTTLHTRQSSIQNNRYKVSHKHSRILWWWTNSSPKHVEIDKYKYTKKNCEPSWFIYKTVRRSRSIKHKMHEFILICVHATFHNRFHSWDHDN
jgi:hypothetical protein